MSDESRSNLGNVDKHHHDNEKDTTDDVDVDTHRGNDDDDDDGDDVDSHRGNVEKHHRSDGDGFDPRSRFRDPVRSPSGENSLYS